MWLFQTDVQCVRDWTDVTRTDNEKQIYTNCTQRIFNLDPQRCL